jgi:FAD:protein FMN transferase
MTVRRRDLFALDFARRSQPSTSWLRVHRTAMACRFEVTLPPADAGQVDAAREALNEADRIEALLTVFRDTSEVARLNRECASADVRTLPEVFDLLQRCARLHAETGGAFDVTSTPLSRTWGFLRREGRMPKGDEIDAARALVGLDRVTLDSTAMTVRFAVSGMALNFGAIGKGYAVDRMGGLLRARTVRHALVSAGGSSVLAIGGHGRGWTIDIRSPRVASGRIARLYLRDGALGTSGAGEQFVVVDGKRYGHVIDPRTGWPAHGVVSASVITADAARADALSTAFLIGGPELARRYCDAHPETMALLLGAAATELEVFGWFPGATVMRSRAGAV